MNLISLRDQIASGPGWPSLGIIREDRAGTAWGIGPFQTDPKTAIEELPCAAPLAQIYRGSATNGTPFYLVIVVGAMRAVCCSVVEAEQQAAKSPAWILYGDEESPF